MFKKILFITLSNIGDCILTLPVLDVLRRQFPESLIDVMVGLRPSEIFQNNPLVNQLIIYDKHANLKDKFFLIIQLRREKYDLVIDLRNSIFPLLVNAKNKTTPFLRIPKGITHMKDRHLARLAAVIDVSAVKPRFLKRDKQHRPRPYFFSTNSQETAYRDEQKPLVILSPGARSHTKRWNEKGFAEICDKLIDNYKVNIILVGDQEDKKIAAKIKNISKHNLTNLCGETSLLELAALLKKSSLLISNDSAVMHLGSYLNIPVVGIFGPTDPKKYGPWSDRSIIIQKHMRCIPCQKAQCKFATLQCLEDIKIEDVYNAASRLLDGKTSVFNNKYKRIIIVRTDRIGDVVLTTPMIKALKEASPDLYVAIMVAPQTVDIVKNNPYLDEVIVYDKKKIHRGLWKNLKFAQELKKKKFDLALIMHTKNRTNVIIWLAGIKERMGYYNKKCGFLLTKRFVDTRRQGLKHESEYCLDILRASLGIEPKDNTLFMPVNKKDEAWAENILKEHKITKNDLLVAIHPGASCPSKRWPIERFREVAKILQDRYKAKLVLIGGKETIYMAACILKSISKHAINLVGRTSIAQLASILKHCKILVSNDSGPVHISTAVGTPVVAIYSRNEPGITPKRWGPLGKQDITLHKQVGCKVCRAHKCKIGFACLKAVTTRELLEAIDKILKI